MQHARPLLARVLAVHAHGVICLGKHHTRVGCVASFLESATTRGSCTTMSSTSTVVSRDSAEVPACRRGSVSRRHTRPRAVRRRARLIDRAIYGLLDTRARVRYAGRM